MSWNDPCMECGNPRYGCTCTIIPPKPKSPEEIKVAEEKQKEANKECEEKGHDFEYVFIVYKCKRCGKTSDY